MSLPTRKCTCAGCWACNGNVPGCTCDLVSAWDLLGINPNFTGDLTTTEYMDKQRGAE